MPVDPSCSVCASTAICEAHDPVVKEYDIFITPEMEQQLMLLKYVGRPADQPVKASEMRIKPCAGFVEVDLPINIHENYDRQKGVKFGEAIRKTKGYGQKAYGIASGFQRDMPRLSRPAATEDDAEANDTPAPAITTDDNFDDYVRNFDDANEKGHVLNKMTWSGQFFKRETWDPIYMIGVFRGSELHLSFLNASVMMQPATTYLDAVAQVEAASRRQGPSEPRAFMPVVQRQIALTPAEKTRDYFAKAYKEEWCKLRHCDAESDEAYEAFEAQMFVKDLENAPKLVSTAGKSILPAKKKIVDVISDDDEE